MTCLIPKSIGYYVKYLERCPTTHAVSTTLHCISCVLVSGMRHDISLHRLYAGLYSLPRDAPPAHVARAALLAPHGGRDGPDHGELGGGAGLLAAG